MKRAALAWVIVFGFFASLPGQEVHDFRVVNGVTVDLGPLHAWLAKSKDEREGERPMKHWKELQILEVERTGGWFKCKVEIEGLTLTNLVANLPAQVQAVIEKMNQTDARIELLRAQIARGEVVVRRADAVTPHGALGTAEYVDAVRNQRAQVNLAGAKLEEAKATLAKLEAERHEYISSNLSETKVLAMFTGRKYGGLEIWDCGIKKVQ